jgi:hypothetical protein
MKITMLVSVSRSDGFSASIGQILDVPAEQAQSFVADGWAVEVNDAASTHPQADAPTPIVGAPSGTIDLADGVDDAEATLAGKTLARRKKGA